MINVYDYETLGQIPTESVILSCAAVTVDEERFSSDTPYQFDELVGMVKEIKLDVAQQVNVHGRKIEKSTLDWWAKQSAESREILKPNPELDRPLEELIPWMESIFTKGAFVYTRGNSFDPPFTTSVCNGLGIKSPYPWWNIRDIRTFIEAALLQFSAKTFSNSFVPDELLGKFVAHNALHDVAMDIIRIQFVTRLSQGLSVEGFN